MTEAKIKVYCGKCKWFCEDGFVSCEHKSNIQKVADTWEKEEFEYIYAPFEINKNNDCKNYKKRGTGK